MTGDPDAKSLPPTRVQQASGMLSIRAKDDRERKGDGRTEAHARTGYPNGAGSNPDRLPRTNENARTRFMLCRLRRLRRVEVRPALGELAVGDSPDDDAAELELHSMHFWEAC